MLAHMAEFNRIQKDKVRQNYSVIINNITASTEYSQRNSRVPVTEKASKSFSKPFRTIDAPKAASKARGGNLKNF